MLLNTIILFIVVLSILLMIVVLIQNKGGGVAAPTAASQVMGVRRTGDILEKATWGFIIAIMLFSVSTSVVINNSEGDLPGTSINVERAREAQLPSLNAPAPVGGGTALDSAAAK